MRRSAILSEGRAGSSFPREVCFALSEKQRKGQRAMVSPLWNQSPLVEGFANDQRRSLELQVQRLLGSIIQVDQYVGDVYSIGYETALVQIHDFHRERVGGIPSLCFLIATRINPQ